MISVLQTALNTVTMGSTMGLVGAIAAIAAMLSTVYLRFKKGIVEIEERDIAIRTALLGIIAVVLSYIPTPTGIIKTILSIGSLGLLGVLAGEILIIALIPLVKAVKKA